MTERLTGDVVMIIRAGLVVMAVMGSAALAADKAPAVRDVPVGGMIAATIDGTPVSLRVDPGAPGLVLLTVATAERLALKSGALALGYAVGGQGAMQATTVKPMTFGVTAVKRRVGFPSSKHDSKDRRWIGRAYANVGDGSIGPGSLPEPVIRIALRAPRAGERTVALPLVDGGGLFGRLSGEFAQVTIAGQPVRVRFDPYHPRTTVTANAATLIATAQGGTMTGASVPVEIAFGIARPVRTMTLARPLAIGPLAISTLGGAHERRRQRGGDPRGRCGGARPRRDRRHRQGQARPQARPPDARRRRARPVLGNRVRPDREGGAADLRVMPNGGEFLSPLAN
jgi:hypothetical protein